MSNKVTPSSPQWSLKWLTTLGMAALSALIIGVGFWVSKIELAGAVIATGLINNNAHVIQHETGGTVDEILVHDGDYVKKGDILFRLNDQALRAQYNIIRSQLTEISARSVRLRAERDGDRIMNTPKGHELTLFDQLVFENALQGQEQLFQARIKTMDQTLAQLANKTRQLNRQIEALNVQISALNDQQSLLDNEIENLQNLRDKGLSTESRLMALLRERSRLSGLIGQTNGQSGALSAEIASTNIEILRITELRREKAIDELRDNFVLEQELYERLQVATARLSATEILSPIDGIIHDNQITSQNIVIRPAEPLMYVIPQTPARKITLDVSPIDIDSIYPLQQVSLRLVSLSARHTPVMTGQVNDISADRLINTQTGQSFYRVTVQISEDQFSSIYAKRLVPGMPVEAYFTTEKETVLSYFLRPISDYFTRARSS